MSERTMPRLPHPIPYQGSKRNLAPTIGRYVPDCIGTWYEPFAGSAAMALWTARHRKPKRIVLGDSLAPITQLWSAILADPRGTAARYAEIWAGQKPEDWTPYTSTACASASTKAAIRLTCFTSCAGA